MVRYSLFIPMAVLLSEAAQARPVSYPGGWTVMQTNSGDASSLHLHVSPNARYSVGVYLEDNRAEGFEFAGLQYNRLVKRWNGRGSQANLYLKLGAGWADGRATASTGNPSAGEAFAAGFADVAFDWETRRWFLGAESRSWGSDGKLQSVRHMARIGVAPYLGDYGDVHTWLMLQVENSPEGSEPIMTTPLLRLFWEVQMVEVVSTLENGTALVNWIVRF